ncbi:Kunitz-type proteinase inhibitor SHTX-3 [Orchesella cincta]|uniref:Kunitz-type proteinase inhibitor SHTX-3 n=1 Tax=Orchesella cincta TaxID=48709 RepID=A0A1D2MYI0_ORCCI|nr:Kunitz-type proteinase inhibitor SHTX-3 [Orchesella cincta]
MNVRQEGNCRARPIVGNCLGAITKWYWNNKVKKCENHIWSGCGPGGLGFPSKLSCQCGCAYCHTMNY